jgi:molybdenum cofactor cytidylyltransferase
MRLRQALNVQRGDIVAFTGAGGKTSALTRLAKELTQEGWRVLCTTTTRISVDEIELCPAQISLSPHALRPEAISRALTQYGSVFLYSKIQGEKVAGITDDMINRLIDTVDSDVVLIEADGARRLPFKAPKAHEPAVPSFASLVVPVAGYDVIGQPLDAEHVYNPAAMIDRFGYLEGEKVRGPWLASALRDEELGLKNVPPSARIVALLNKVPYTSTHRARARTISRLMLLQPRINAVAVGSVQNSNPIMESNRRIAVIILAAGMSTRMGRSKVLLPWDNNRPIIKVIVDRVKRMKFEDLVVVTGHMADQVSSALSHDPVRLVHNRDYREGDMLSSLQTGLRALAPEVSAALIVLGDQPMLDNRVVLQVINAYLEGKGSIVAPSFQNRRGHPLLIDRKFWSEILELPHGGAPRDVINAHNDEIAYVTVDNDSILRDIDTPTDYEEERRRAGLE